MGDNKAVFCPSCGQRMEEGDVFCGNCGARLDVTAAAAAPVRNTERDNGAVVVQNNTATAQNPEAGKSAATASLVLGIVAVVCWFFGYSAIISVICGFIGMTLAGKAKNEGFEGGTRTAGFVLSLIGLIGGALVLIACVACVGSLGMLGASLY